jgi:hypothetical protein
MTTRWAADRAAAEGRAAAARRAAPLLRLWWCTEAVGSW